MFRVTLDLWFTTHNISLVKVINFFFHKISYSPPLLRSDSGSLECDFSFLRSCEPPHLTLKLPSDHRLAHNHPFTIGNSKEL